MPELPEVEVVKRSLINKIQNLNYKIPGDISSCAFFIVLTALSNNSKLKIKNVNINPTRVGILKILKISRSYLMMVNQKLIIG